jgi:hypothetical protein
MVKEKSSSLQFEFLYYLEQKDKIIPFKILYIKKIKKQITFWLGSLIII